jgi:hypothetical protein
MEDSLQEQGKTDDADRIREEFCVHGSAPMWV